jgi:hypothetical protein
MAKDKKPIVIAAGPISETIQKISGLVKADAPNAYTYSVKSAESKEKKPMRLSFTEDPTASDQYAGIYKIKRGLLPDYVLKQIRLQNHLIASILRVRGNVMAMHGHIKRDRFDIGVTVEVKPEFEEIIKPEQMGKIKDRIARFEKILVNCGHTDGLEQDEHMSLAQFFEAQTMQALTFGRFATEIIYKEAENDEELEDKAKLFHRFRPSDVGTMAKAVASEDDGASIRKGAVSALKRLQQIDSNIKIDIKALEGDKYSVVQIINGVPKMAFTSDEMIVYNMFPSLDIEHNGYPITPIDTCIQNITTHLSIEAYNKLYFQNGRATKGALVIRSDEVDQNTISQLRQEFQASINSVDRSFRTPVIGVNTADSVEWMSMVSTSGDAEFQFLYDQVSRNILSTFAISPDELPGYSHLGRGTNQQTLSESNNEFKLIAARDAGLRPLILKFQAFLNDRLFPIIDPELAQLCHIQLSGLDAQSREQESLRLQQDMPIHMTYDEVMKNVEKQPLGERLGGTFPLNERFSLIADKYLDVGQIAESFLHDPTGYLDPLLKFRRDPFYMQHIQLLMQINPTAVQAALSTRPYTLDMLKMFIQDELDQDEE